MHCVAHKLELAALDTVKQHSYLRKFEDTIKGIFNFYHQSFKRRREVKDIATILEEDLAHISGVKQVRWLASKTRAVKSLLQNLPMITNHLEHAASRKSSDEAAKAKGYLRELSSVKFVMMLHAMYDIFDITSSLSETFQRDNLMVTDVYREVESHVLRLEASKHEQGPKLKEFFSSFNKTEKSFKMLELKGEIPDTTFITEIIDDMIDYIDKWFANFNAEPLKCFAAFQYQLFPSDRAGLLNYGKADLTSLLEHLSAFFPENQHEMIHQQYLELKVKLKPFKTSSDPPAEVFRSFLNSNQESLNLVLQLVEIMLVISPSTAECERGFSRMNLIKNSVRNCLNQESLCMLMNLAIAGPELDEFNPDSSIRYWLNSGPGGKHVHGHVTKTPESL